MQNIIEISSIITAIATSLLVIGIFVAFFQVKAAKKATKRAISSGSPRRPTGT